MRLSWRAALLRVLPGAVALVSGSLAQLDADVFAEANVWATIGVGSFLIVSTFLEQPLERRALRLTLKRAVRQLPPEDQGLLIAARERSDRARMAILIGEVPEIKNEDKARLIDELAAMSASELRHLIKQ